jgi:O-antigen/teichoic acid export membrane protein
LVINVKRHGIIVKLFSGAVLMQAMLSATSLAVGLILIRRTSDVEYSYYILVTNAILLLTQLQNAYIQPSVVFRVTDETGDARSRGVFIGGLYREQRQLFLWAALATLAVAVVAAVLGYMSWQLLLIVIAGIAAALFALFREFFRIVLLAHRRPNDVLRGDVVYVLILICGTLVASVMPHAAAITAAFLAAAGLVGGLRQRRYLAAVEAWDPQGSPQVLRQIFSVGLWAAVGAGIHWAFAYGYNYIVAGALSVSSIAAIAATRQLIMPVNLISTGIGTFMFPTVAAWLQRTAARVVFIRLAMLSAGLILMCSVWLVIAWIFRDWIFEVILKKEFEQRDSLMILWFAIAIAIVLRDQLAYLLYARAKFLALSNITLISAVVSLTFAYFALRKVGQVGALYGVLVGELIGVAGIVWLSMLELRADKRRGPA